MQVTLTTGLLSYTNPDGGTGSINLTNEVDVQTVNGITITNGSQTGTPLMVNKPIITPYWIVRIRMVDGRYFDIFLGTVSNQSGWVGTQAGANAAVADIVAAYA